MIVKTFKVFRFDPDKDKKPYFDIFNVPVKRGTTVIEGLFYIQQNIDPSLAFRFSCRGAVCGSCAMHINGKYRLACETQVLNLKKDTLIIQPLGHLPVIRDLFVDMDRFWQCYREIKPYLMAGSPPPEKERIQTPDERKRLDDMIDCILCGSCFSACTVTGTDGKYIGPAALLKVNRFLRDSRDRIKGERLQIVDRLHGIWRCHTIMSCQEVCPKSLSPTASINEMRMHFLKKH